MNFGPFAVGTFFALIVVLAIFAIIQSIKNARLRREALAKIAADLGMNYVPDDDSNLPGSLTQFGLFNRGDTRRASNTLTGTATALGRPIGVRMGDYRYTTESGSGENKTRTTTNVSYLYARLPFAVAAKWAIRKENFADKLVSAIGFEDINFESAEFSRKFHVKSSDKKFVYDLFDPRMIEWFMAGDSPAIEMIGPDLLIATGSKWKPEEFLARRAWLIAFVERWPTHLIDALDSSVAVR